MTALRPAPAARSRGIGLVEVLVALTAGLLLTGVIAYFYLSGRQANRTHQDVARLQESGRGAIEFVGRAVRQAGAWSRGSGNSGNDAITPADGGGAAPDGLTVRYDPQDGGEADCVGATIASPGMVTLVFAIDPVAHTLTCTNASGATPVVVADNVEDMRIDYAVDTNNDGGIDAYQSGGGVVPAQVRGLRVSFLLRGPTPYVATGPQTFDYHGATITTTDRYLRQVYTATFSLRNQSYQAPVP